MTTQAMPTSTAADRLAALRRRAAPAVGRVRLGVSGPDALAAAALLGLIAVVAWNRFVFDSWLSRFDLMTFFVPWYQLLGERLRGFDVPAWNPHLFAGTPLAGDPESGWMYLPTMLFAPLLPIMEAFKAQVAFQLTVAGLSTFLLARTLGMGTFAAFGAALVFVFGPFLKWNTHCCLIFAQWAAWVPLALLGVELALRTGRRRFRLAAWFVTGFAVSQGLAGWIGEGWLYALGLPAAFAAYRTLLPPATGLPLGRRLVAGAATVVAGPLLGLALGAAGVLPRLAFSAESFLAGGYEQLPNRGVLNPPWTVDRLLGSLFGAGYDARSVAFGGAVVVLAGLGLLAGRGWLRRAVPFFAALTIIPPFLALGNSPFHPLFGLLPRWAEFHEHDAWRAISLMSVGPAILAGVALDSLTVWRRRRWLLPIVLLPLALLLVVVARQRETPWPIAQPPLVAAALATALVALVLLLPRAPYLARLSRDRFGPPPLDRAGRWAAVGLLALLFAQPTGLELAGSWLGWPRDPTWEPWWRADPAAEAALARDLAPTDPGGAGEFLQRRLAEDGPFRSVGYGGVDYPGQQPPTLNYMERRLDPAIGAILVNGRPMALGLYDIQGYNPLQLARYVEFLRALNGREIDYHVSYLMPSGVASPLLDLLNVRYVVVDAALPGDRPDVATIAASGREVFRSPLAVVYERSSNPSHAWVVHDVRPVARGEALPPLVARSVDPRRTALVEPDGELPPGLAPRQAPAAPVPAAAIVTRYEPERIELAVSSAEPGLLVLAEVYESGWQAAVNGQPAEILPTFHALRGIPVPAGDSTVELRYAPWSLRLGLAVTGLALVGMVGSFAVAGWSWARRPLLSRTPPIHAGSTAELPG